MRIAIVIPVKDEDPAALEALLSVATVDKWQSKHAWETLIVDDGSVVPVPARYRALRFETSQGYGAALKAGMLLAHQPDYIVTCDGDGQHRWQDIQRLVEFVEEFPECAMVIGNRRVVETSFKRYVGRKCLNMLASVFAWSWIPDLNSGLRIIKWEALKGYLPILCNSFSFTTSLTMAMLCDGYRIDWLPIRVLPRPSGQSHVRVLRHGWITLWYIVVIGLALRTRRLRSWVRPLWQPA